MKKIFLITISFIVAGCHIVFGQVTFNYTGAVQTYKVPCWMDSVSIKLWGAGGAGGGADSHNYAPGGAGGNGGGAAYVIAVIKVTPGDVLKIYVGGGGTGGTGCVAGTGGGTGGFGYGGGGGGGETGGGGCSGGGGGGGGSSAVYDSTTTTLLLAAAGGGGGGGGGGIIDGFGEAGGGGGVNGNSNVPVNATGGITGANATSNGGAGQNKTGDGSGGGGGGGGATNGGTGGDAPNADAGAGGGAGGNSIGATIINGNGEIPGNSSDPNLCLSCATGSDGEVLYNNNTASPGGNGIVIFSPVDSTATLSAKTTPADTSVCPGNSVHISATGGTIYSWSPSTGLNNDTIANPTATPLSTTTYTVKIKNGSGCFATDSVVIKMDTIQVFAGPDTTVCLANTSVQLNASDGTTYSWSPSTGLNNAAKANPIASPASTTTYTVTVKNIDGCSASGNVVIKIDTVHVFAGPDTTVCVGNQVRLNATGGTIYAWSPTTGLNNSNIENPTASPASAITYTVTIKDMNGCFAFDSAVIRIDSIQSSAGPNTTICLGNSIQLNATGGYQFSWLPADGLSSTNIANPMASPTVSTTYTVTVANLAGCLATETADIEVEPGFQVHAGPDTTICDNQSVTVSVTGGNFYQWSPSDFLPCTNCAKMTISPTRSTNYSITVTDSNGCKQRANITIDVNQYCSFVTMPSAFSPNGDGNNDRLGPLGKDIANIEWRVYNRWGQMLFSAENLNNTWDGKFQGEEEPVGVYVWFISAKMTDGKQIVEKGNVTLLR